MTEEELNELQIRLDTAIQLKNDLNLVQDITEIISTNNYDYAYRVGMAVLKWISNNADEYNAFMNFVENHGTLIRDALEKL